jgi:Zn-dependent protease
MELTAETLALGLMWYVVFLFSTTVHEAAHAFAAWRLGDPTAYHGGQVTLNPLPHVAREPFGTVLFPLLTFFLSGWMMGWASAPYDPQWADRYPKRAALMAAAGPLSNLLLMAIAAVVLRYGLESGALIPPPSGISFSQIVVAVQDTGIWVPLAKLLSIAFMLNLLLFSFNLLPLPPLDGSAMMPLVLGDRLGSAYLEFIRQPMWSFVGLLAAWRLFGYVFTPLASLALGLLYY